MPEHNRVPRSTVYRVIDGERAYQDSRWNGDTSTTEGLHTVTEWLVYIDDYVREAMHHVSRNADPAAIDFALNGIRKIAGMAVACMEQNGVRDR